MRRDLHGSVDFFGGVLLLGTFGYMGLQGWGFLDSLFMTVITLSTVGYGETRPLDGTGRLFTIGLILIGITAVGNFINQAARAYSEGYFQRGLRQRRLQKMIAQMQDHFIVCGYGRIGQQICQDLVSDGALVVVLEKDPQLVQRAREAGLVVLQGDASSDQLLIDAGIGHACCVLCALPSDAENLYIVVSAKILNPRVRTIARAASEEGSAKLSRVGADQVVSPYLTGAKRMAALALRPHVVNLVESATTGSRKVFIEELLLSGSGECPLIGHTLGEADRADGKFIGAPQPEAQIQAGDTLIGMGSGEQIQRLAALLLPQGRA